MCDYRFFAWLLVSTIFWCVIISETNLRIFEMEHYNFSNPNETDDHSINSSMEINRTDLSTKNDFLQADDSDYLKETTKIVTIKIYPPPAKNGSKEAVGSVRIPQPFGMNSMVATTIASTTVPTTKAMEITKGLEKVENVGKDGFTIGIVLTTAKELAIDFNSLCRDGPPYVVDGSPLYCTLNSGCPTGYWCHTGSSKSYTFCCPNAQMDNGCNLPMSSGKGDGRMERWYYDANDSVCKLFIYTGYGGNQNNFLTNQDCVDNCGLRLTLQTIAPLARGSGQPTKDQIGLLPTIDQNSKILQQVVPIDQNVNLPINTDQASKNQNTNPSRLSSPFGKTSTPYIAPVPSSVPTWASPFGSFSNQPSSQNNVVTGKPVTVDILARCRDVVNVPRLDRRRSEKTEIRWYYDYVLDSCKSFSYTGTDGTSNNFGSEYECHYHCKGRFIPDPPTTQAPVPIPSKITDYDQIANPCDLPPNAGHGYLRTARWYYDAENRYCQEFFYSGQGGNLNNFENEEQCLFACVLLMPKQLRGDPCELPRVSGQGTATLTRFFFNRLIGQCETFLYTGEGGNRNNFFTLQECRLTCHEKRPIFPTSRPNRATTSNLFYPSSTLTFTNPIATTTTSTQSPPPVYSTPSTSHQEFQHSSTVPPLPPNYRWEETGWSEIYNPFSNQTTTPDSLSTSTHGEGRVHPCKGVALPEYINCGPFNNYQCPVSMYCHVGSTALESVCCPTRGGKSQTINACTLSVDPGSGTAQLARWYFNSHSGLCEMFIYHGVKGNQNNFLTYDMCMHTCGLNPCGVGAPHKINGQNVQCSTLHQSVCPDSHYCHVGADVMSSVCCPRHGNPCTMPISLGSGKAQLQRWAFAASAKSCQTFIYSGLAGNENNFITEADCIGTCQAHLAPSNPCSAGRPAQTANGIEFIYCSTSNLNACPSNYYCHVGGSPESTLCCPLSAGSPTPCQLALVTGTGNTALSRWYFDMASSTCKPFVYTGMAGNENNFLSLADCRQICPEFDNPCPGGTPPMNTVTGQVNFCDAINPLCPTSYWCHIGADRQTSVCCPFAANPCSMPRVQGTGRHQLQRFYFDQDVRQCRTFMYNGSSGNQNNFLSLAECEATCPSNNYNSEFDFEY